MLTIFDTNIYRVLAAKTDFDEAKAFLGDVVAAERRAGYSAMLTTHVALELISHLLDDGDGNPSSICLKACRLMYAHCGNDTSYHAISMPHTQAARDVFGITAENYMMSQEEIGKLLYRLSKGPVADVLDEHRENIERIRSYIQNSEKMFADSVIDMCHTFDPDFDGTFPLFKDNEKGRKEYLSKVRSPQYKDGIAMNYLIDVRRDLRRQGYVSLKSDAALRKALPGYHAGVKAPVELMTYFMEHLTQGNFDVRTDSRANFLWDFHVMHVVGRTVRGEHMLLVTNDGPMREAAANAGYGEYVTDIFGYLDRLGVTVPDRIYAAMKKPRPTE